MNTINLKYIYCLFFMVVLPSILPAEDGSQLWLRYPTNRNNIQTEQKATSEQSGVTISVALKELNLHWTGQRVELRIDKKLKALKDGYEIKGNGQLITVTSAQEVGLL